MLTNVCLARYLPPKMELLACDTDLYSLVPYSQVAGVSYNLSQQSLGEGRVTLHSRHFIAEQPAINTLSNYADANVPLYSCVKRE